jgi:hypothetical protein
MVARCHLKYAAEAESVPIQDLNKGDPKKGCAGENSYLRNGTCWQRVITDPRFKSYEVAGLARSDSSLICGKVAVHKMFFPSCFLELGEHYTFGEIDGLHWVTGRRFASARTHCTTFRGLWA